MSRKMCLLRASFWVLVVLALTGCSNDSHQSKRDCEDELRQLKTSEWAAQLALATKQLDLLNEGDTNTVISLLATAFDSNIILLSHRTNLDTSANRILATALDYRKTNLWLRKYMTGGDEIHKTADRFMKK